ncbi:hypothetical protein [Dactylosporangium roseum]|nr:hypothetical protein [Dactylosporangium roseum]
MGRAFRSGRPVYSVSAAGRAVQARINEVLEEQARMARAFEG